MKLYLNLLLVLFLFIFTSCGKKNLNNIDTKSHLINGAGATFPYPIYSKWFYEYNKINPKANINYQSIGSGGGVRQITEGTVDFGASDSPLSEKEIEKANNQNSNSIMNIPTVLGSVVISYNIPGVKESLNLTQEAIAKIYMGKITNWNDPIIQNSNSGLILPNKEIIVCYRTDGSGTTFVFTDFLSKANDEWKTLHGVAKDVRFPVGQGGKGNEGVTGLIKQLEYSIGYIEYVYATQNNLSFANIENPLKEFVTPTIESIVLAADVSKDLMPENLGQSITNANGSGAYPVSSYTYILLFENQKDAKKGKILKEFMKWALSDGQEYAIKLGYAPLPKGVIEKAMIKINSLNNNGNTL